MARGARGRVPRAGQHAVLLVGLPEPRPAAAHARAAAARRGGRPTRWRDEARATSMRIFFVAPDYHEGTAEEVRQRLGQHVPDRRPRRHRAALPHREDAAGARVPERARTRRARDLVRLRRLQPLPRHRLDEGAVRELRVSASRTSAAAAARPIMLANDPAAADPVCVKSPHHDLVTRRGRAGRRAAPRWSNGRWCFASRPTRGASARRREPVQGVDASGLSDVAGCLGLTVSGT